MCWAVGKPFFGIVPGEIYQKKGMRILLVQAENDEGDLAEMRDGVERGSAELTPEENALARRRIAACTAAPTVLCAHAGPLGGVGRST